MLRSRSKPGEYGEKPAASGDHLPFPPLLTSATEDQSASCRRPIAWWFLAFLTPQGGLWVEPEVYWSFLPSPREEGRTTQGGHRDELFWGSLLFWPRRLLPWSTSCLFQEVHTQSRSGRSFKMPWGNPGSWTRMWARGSLGYSTCCWHWLGVGSTTCVLEPGMVAWGRDGGGWVVGAGGGLGGVGWGELTMNSMSLPLWTLVGLHGSQRPLPLPAQTWKICKGLP